MGKQPARKAVSATVVLLVVATGVGVLWDWAQLDTDKTLGVRIDLLNARVDDLEECP